MSDVNPCFSEDIWFEILKNLPVKTLGKCRCVCKSWHSLIASPSFMASHLKHYTQNDANSLFLFRKTNEQYLFFLDSGCIPLQPYHTSVHVTLKRYSCFVGSIHGLICLSDGRYLGDKSRIILWNPFLSKMINLPISMTVTRQSFSLTSVLGFGYNTYHNDHRVIKISFNRNISDNINGFYPLVEVYSVCDRIWRTIPTDYLINNSVHWVSSSNCFVNGVINWLTWENGIDSSISDRILSFDMVEETFRVIEFPIPIVARKLTDTLGIFEYKSELSVSRCKYDRHGFYKFGFCEIWVRRNECWSMILSAKLGPLILTGPIEYLGRNGSLFGFARIRDKMLFLCDTRTETFSEIGHHQRNSTKFAAFSESLVLLDQITDVCTDDALERHIVHSN